MILLVRFLFGLACSICLVLLFVTGSGRGASSRATDIGERDRTVEIGWPLACLELKNDRLSVKHGSSWDIEAGRYEIILGASINHVLPLNLLVDFTIVILVATIGTMVICWVLSRLRLPFTLRLWLAATCCVAVYLSIRWSSFFGSAFVLDLSESTWAIEQMVYEETRNFTYGLASICGAFLFYTREVWLHVL